MRQSNRGSFGAYWVMLMAAGVTVAADVRAENVSESRAAALAAIPDHDLQAMGQAVAEAGWTFTLRDNWVSRHLRGGGRVEDVTGYKPDPNWKATAKFAPVMRAMALPTHFDWRDQVPGAFEPARNQGSCGSCWAFATTGTVETAYAIAFPGRKIDLSEQSIVACSGAGSCGGGYFSALNYMQRTGVADETQDPYVARNTSCKKTLKPVTRIADWQYIGDGNSEPTIEEIKAAIYQYGPVSVTVNGSFSSYGGGVYNKCNNSGTNHMVMLVGWDDKEQYWIMRNSWGTSWGEDGYMRIKWEGSSGRKCNRVGETAAFVVFEK